MQRDANPKQRAALDVSRIVVYMPFSCLVASLRHLGQMEQAWNSGRRNTSPKANLLNAIVPRAIQLLTRF